MSTLPTLTLVIPVFNEASQLPQLCAALSEVRQELGQVCQTRCLFVDDGSTDASAELLAEFVRPNPNDRLLSFSRNFGKEAALTAGLRHAEGDAVVLMDADLQHPPAYLGQFVEAWQAGAEVVIGQRRQSRSSLTRRLASWLYYRLLGWLSSQDTLNGNTDFRLLDRQVVEAFNQLPEHDRMVRELIDWLGFRREIIEFDAVDRTGGGSNYSYRLLIHLALTSFMANSLFPLKVAGYLGIVMMLLSLGIGGFALLDRVFWGQYDFSGAFLSGVLNMFLTSLTLSSLGLVALYVGSIKQDTRNRPLYVIREQKEK